MPVSGDLPGLRRVASCTVISEQAQMLVANGMTARTIDDTSVRCGNLPADFDDAQNEASSSAE
jgi:hypothetical protein